MFVERLAAVPTTPHRRHLLPSDEDHGGGRQEHCLIPWTQGWSMGQCFFLLLILLWNLLL